MAKSYDRTRGDSCNIVALEHVNVTIPDQRPATAFYIAGMGFTRDPYIQVGLNNMWVNIGRSQCHLPNGSPQRLRGTIGIVVPDLGQLAQRLKTVTPWLKDGDEGPNTGGMGAYSPARVVSPGIHAKVMREVIQPVIAGMRQEGMPFAGFLYAGLMIGGDGQVKVLEFNCRLGDPEAQPIMLRLKSDLFVLLEHALAGTLDKVEAEWDTRAELGVVLAAQGYPGAPRKGDVIGGLSRPSVTTDADYHVFHSGTVLNGEHVVTGGGRVLCVTALGHSVKMAQRRAYEIAAQIHFNGMQMRHDIGYRALEARSTPNSARHRRGA